MIWPYHYTPYIWPMTISTVFLLLLSVYAWRNRSVPGAIAFAVQTLILTLWSVGAALELAASDVALKIFWVQFQAAMQFPAVIAGLCFALSYADLGRWLSRRNLLLLAIPPILTALSIFTNDLHHWMWLEFALVRGEVQPIRGIGIWIVTIFGFILSLVALFVFSRLFVRSRLHRWPAAICLVGLIVSRAAYIVDIAGTSPFAPVDLGTLSITFLAVMYAIALFRYRLFNLTPIAREAMIEQMCEGFLVLDSQQRIVDLNPMSATMLHLTESQIKGRQIADILPGYHDLYISLDASGITPNEITLGEGSESRYYALSASNLKNRRGIGVGRMLLLRDVTGRKQAEGSLRESEEKLRLVYENAFDGISIYEEFPGKRIRKFLECNERYAQMSGRSIAELVEIGDTMLVQKPLALAPYAKPRQGLSEAQSEGFFSWIRPDGRENIIEYSATSFKLGERFLTIGVDRDVTERKQAEEQLLQQQQALIVLQEREMQVARQVQASLLPDQHPDIPGWGFAAFWQPARIVAGDFYDWFSVRLNPGLGTAQGWGIVIADVSDKGMPAALFMAMSRSTVRANVRQGSPPCEAVTLVNRLICTDSTSGMFVSLFYGQLDPSSGELVYVNAGHNPPLLLRAGEKELIELTLTGMVLGIEETAAYTEVRVQLSVGDLLVLYTDGLTEEMDVHGQEFGLNRVQRLILDHRTAPAAELAAALKNAVTTWSGGPMVTALHDDVTVVVIKRSSS